MDPCHVLVFLGQIDSHLHDLSQTEVHKDNWFSICPGPISRPSVSVKLASSCHEITIVQG